MKCVSFIDDCNVAMQYPLQSHVANDDIFPPVAHRGRRGEIVCLFSPWNLRHQKIVRKSWSENLLVRKFSLKKMQNSRLKSAMLDKCRGVIINIVIIAII